LIGGSAKRNAEKVVIALFPLCLCEERSDEAIPALTKRHYFKKTLFEGGGTNECKNIG